MHFFLFIALVILIAFGIVTVQNPTAVVSLKFIIWTFSDKPLPIILAVPFAAGILAGIFLFIPTLWKKSRAIRMHKKRLQELEKDLSIANEKLEADRPDVEAESHKDNN